jgi:hypothetical protein
LDEGAGPKTLDKPPPAVPVLGTNNEPAMAASSKLMITEAERRFPARLRVAIPPGGFGQRLTEMHAWLDQNCGADGWAITLAGTRGVPIDAVSIYVRDATLASAFVARWCVGGRADTTGGVFRVREDEPASRVAAGLHRTP